MIATICHRHRTLNPHGQRCPDCKREAAERGKPRRQQNKTLLGRHSRHWRELSYRLIRRHRNTDGPVCPQCGTVETPGDPGSKLTLDLTRGGDHTTATEDECQVVCRRCHGRLQGGRGASRTSSPETSPLAHRRETHPRA